MFSQHPRRILTILTLSWLGFTACLKPNAHSGVKGADSGVYAKRRWVQKVSATLNRGVSSLSDAQIEELAAHDYSAILDQLMKGPAFEATLLDFLDFYENDKTDTPDGMPTAGPLTIEKLLAQATGLKKARLNAVAALLKGGDFFALFDPNQATLQSPLRAPEASPAPTDPFGSAPPPPSPAPSQAGAELPASGPDATDRQSRLIDSALTRALTAHDEFAAQANPSSGADVSALICSTIYRAAFSVSNALQNAGYSPEVAGELTWDWYPQISSQCSVVGPIAGAAHTTTNAERLAVVRAKIELAFAAAHTHNFEVYSPKSLADAVAIDFTNLKLHDTQTTQPFGSVTFPYLRWSLLLNSSTNYNRKRAAHMLKTYFCDDLVPIGGAAGANRPGAHASDPACQACHYKLDPMGAFFRERQEQGRPLPAGTDSIVFDDGLTLTGAAKQAYLNTWKGTDGHEWNAGYIRSPQKPAANSYGSTLEDLYGIMRTAPEVRQCLVQRLAEYFISKEQAFDGAWLASLSKPLLAKNAASSGAASGQTITATIKTLLLSNAVREPRPQGDKCYDYTPNTTPSKLPCGVAYIIKMRCAGCHSDGSEAHNGLSLKDWITTADGTETFLHLDASSHAQVTKKETFLRMKSRLESPDANLRMPKGDSITATEKAVLFKWVNAVLDQL